LPDANDVSPAYDLVENGGNGSVIPNDAKISTIICAATGLLLTQPNRHLV